MRRLLLIGATALSVASIGLADDLTDRLKPLGDPGDRVLSAIYDRYPGGRPRRVVATLGQSSLARLLLVRFPDSANGKLQVLDSEELDGSPGEVLLEKVIDSKDVVVKMLVRHGTRAIVDRVTDDHLARIANEFGEAIDLDGDGVPEIITLGYAGRNRCGVQLFVSLSRWNGESYVADGRKYVTALSRGVATDEDEVLLSASKHYVIRTFGPGRVTLDDEDLEPGRRFTTEEDCHVLALQGGNSRTRVFLEERP